MVRTCLDRAYDEFADRVICSEAFETCKNKNKKNDCIAYHKRTGKWKRCWHITACPLGKIRR